MREYLTDEKAESNAMNEFEHSNKANKLNKAHAFGTIDQRNHETCHDEQGCCQGNVFGTYLHGVFDHPQMAQQLINALCERKGIDPAQISAVDFAQYKETQYDLLAQGVRESLDMEKIYRILEEGI